LKSTNISTRKQCIGAGGPLQYLNEEAQLIICLIWMRQYISLKLLAWIIGLDVSSVQRYNRASINVLYRYFRKRIYIPSKDH
jgi:hypothetical protein